MADTEPCRILRKEVLSDDWGTLTRYEIDLRLRSGERERQTREVYDRGNGAVCLLHDPETDRVLVTRQFRLPAFLNGGKEAVVEAPAGLLEGADPAERMRAELEEETGYRIAALDHLFDVYMSPGSVTEYLAFFEGTYSEGDRVSEGGGKADEGEDIEVLHVPLSDAMTMIDSGGIRDAKTIVLLQRLAIRRLEAARTTS